MTDDITDLIYQTRIETLSAVADAIDGGCSSGWLREGLNVIAGRSWGCGCDCCVKSSDIARAALSHSQAPEPCPKCADSPDATQAREMLAYVLGIEHGGPAAPAPGGE